MGWALLPCDAQARPLARPPSTPWVRYLALSGAEILGGGGFAGPPLAGTVEIGYFTLPGQQRQGHGRRTAAALLQLVHQADPGLAVIAHTRREAKPAAAPDAAGRPSQPGLAEADPPSADRCASARILRSLGFGPPRAAHDAELGPVWRWTLAAPGRHGQRQTLDAGQSGHERPHRP